MLIGKFKRSVLDPEDTVTHFNAVEVAPFWTIQGTVPIKTELFSEMVLKFVPEIERMVPPYKLPIRSWEVQGFANCTEVIVTE